VQRIVTTAVAVLLCTLSAQATSSATTSMWQPSASDRFQIILSASPTAAQMKGPFSVLEFDGFDATASQVAQVHALGKRAVCYIDAGTWENWRPDAKNFPASVLGKADSGWPGERWLDIRRQDILLPLMKKRFAMCVRKGFDAVDPDNVNGVENRTGFPLTTAQQLSYDRAIAALAHADNLAVALKSYASQAKALEPSFDFVVDEQCVMYQECSSFGAFVSHAQPVFDIEYTKTLKFCASLPAGVFGIAKHLSLDAWTLRCP